MGVAAVPHLAPRPLRHLILLLDDDCRYRGHVHVLPPARAPEALLSPHPEPARLHLGHVNAGQAEGVIRDVVPRHRSSVLCAAFVCLTAAREGLLRYLLRFPRASVGCRAGKSPGNASSDSSRLGVDAKLRSEENAGGIARAASTRARIVGVRR
eukprot:6174972-Pleurochrysis_carterae.AAC.3